MILTGQKIEELMKKNKLIKKGNLENIHSSSDDLTTSKYILRFKNENKAIELMNAKKINNMYEQVKITDGYHLKPGECILIPLEDEFNMPDNICGSIRGRTSFNRLGIFTTIQHINPGYKGKINITIVNNSPNTYEITPNIQIAQVVFESMEETVKEELLYNNEPNPVYQDEDGMQGSKIYKDYIGKVVRHFKGNYYYIENIFTICYIIINLWYNNIFYFF